MDLENQFDIRDIIFIIAIQLRRLCLETWLEFYFSLATLMLEKLIVRMCTAFAPHAVQSYWERLHIVQLGSDLKRGLKSEQFAYYILIIHNTAILLNLFIDYYFA